LGKGNLFSVSMALSQTSGFIGTKQSTKNNTLDSVDWEHRTKQDGQIKIEANLKPKYKASRSRFRDHCAARHFEVATTAAQSHGTIDVACHRTGH
jgi:hypothetical protein